MYVQWSLVIMNCWGPKEFVHSKVIRVVKMYIGLGSEGVFVVSIISYQVCSL